jgi:hypothetical protein
MPQEMKSRRYKMSREEVNTLLYVSQACEGGGVDLTLRLYEELKGSFTADENTDVMLVSLRGGRRGRTHARTHTPGAAKWMACRPIPTSSAR